MATATVSSTRPGSESKRVLKISQADFHRYVTHCTYKAACDLILKGHATGVKFKDDPPYDEQCDICIQVKITCKAILEHVHPAEHDIEITKYSEKFHSDT
ncbi:hypothetical protein GSI_01969 [Ganoderma sinense ZZ0214-1]|uniref:Uncharacterized protein n=1 Tax=Ganoderma sinense ZZ0214-1 TaxID=1077348 RepID=A0A2G8SRB3_9APHY|nr:hypothetical protein GSI_01969 [Ganoderma sinense ZZ0214-1]